MDAHMPIYTYDKSPSIKFRIMRAAINWSLDPFLINKALDNGTYPTPSHDINDSDLYDKIQTNRRIGQFDVHYVGNKHANNTVIFYLHGGGYVAGALKQHYQFINKLINNLNVQVVIPDYPLAPSHTFSKTYAFIEKAYNQLLTTHPQAKIIFMGDSAGGGLALGFYLKLKNERKPLPHEMILIAPCVDSSFENPILYKYLKNEPMLKDITGLLRISRIYSEGDSRNPLVSPLYGDFKNTKPFHIFIGTNDILYPDCKRLYEKLKAQNIDIHFNVYEKMIHCWPIAIQLEEANHAFERMADIINAVGTQKMKRH